MDGRAHVTKSELGEYVIVEGLKTFYIKFGSGHPVVLFHGAAPGACSRVSWKLNIEPLAAAGFTVYAFDQPGFGHTDYPKDHSLEQRVAHARSFLNTLQLDRFHLIGNSVGAYIAARIALEDPRTGRLVLVSSGTIAPKGSAESEKLANRHSEELREYSPSIDNMRTLTMGTLFNKELVTEQLVQERYEMSTGKNFEAQLARRKTAAARPIHGELRNLKCKTLILWGNNDRGAAVERALLLFQLIPSSELHIFDRCAHWVQWDQAARFNQIVADFLGISD
jgi:pimeloyl-ACP methyl ester carboxylesterase